MWTTANLPENVRFGPYEGVEALREDTAHKSRYAWLVGEMIEQNTINLVDKSLNNMNHLHGCIANRNYVKSVKFFQISLNNICYFPV